MDGDLRLGANHDEDMTEVLVRWARELRASGRYPVGDLLVMRPDARFAAGLDVARLLIEAGVIVAPEAR